MKRFVRAVFESELWGFVMLLVSCLLVGYCISCQDSIDMSGPTMPPTQTTTSAPPPPPFRGVDFTWSDTRGILVFPGTQAREGQIRELDARLRGIGWPTPTYHACAEVDAWEHTPWADGPRHDSDENLENLRRFLRVTAELRSQVLLDAICTIRDDGTPMAELREWAKTVGAEAAVYNHVAIHVANEHWHPSSSIRSAAQIRTLRDELRAGGFRGLIGTDDNAGRPGDTRYNPELRMLGFWPDFHPWRAPRDPSRSDIQEMVDRNGGFVVISEPTAYSSWRDGDCCTDDRERIRRYMCRCESVSAGQCVWTFHSSDGLSWPAVVPHFEWIPEGRCNA